MEDLDELAEELSGQRYTDSRTGMDELETEASMLRQAYEEEKEE